MHLGRRRNGKTSQIRLVPAARSTDLVIEELGDELLIYDRVTNHAHSLGACAARVWRACDGVTTVDALATRLDLDADTVARALAELRECALLEGEPSAGASGMTRRDLTFKVAKVGAVGAALPLVWSVAGPIPTAAATPDPAQCMLFNDSDCNSCMLVCGCCCCGQSSGGSDPACKLCYTRSGCPTFVDVNNNTGYKCSANADHPNCKAPTSSYTCKDGTVVTLGGSKRCCTHSSG